MYVVAGRRGRFRPSSLSLALLVVDFGPAGDYFHPAHRVCFVVRRPHARCDLTMWYRRGPCWLLQLLVLLWIDLRAGRLARDDRLVLEVPRHRLVHTLKLVHLLDLLALQELLLEVHEHASLLKL